MRVAGFCRGNCRQNTPRPHILCYNLHVVSKRHRLRRHVQYRAERVRIVSRNPVGQTYNSPPPSLGVGCVTTRLSSMRGDRPGTSSLCCTYWPYCWPCWVCYTGTGGTNSGAQGNRQPDKQDKQDCANSGRPVLLHVAVKHTPLTRKPIFADRFTLVQIALRNSRTNASRISQRARLPKRRMG